MQNVFLPHENDFIAWKESHFLPSQDATLDYLRFLANPEDELRPREGGLWPHQWDALLRVVYSREVKRRDFWEDGLLLNIVTGGGKTALIAATMVWFRLAYDVQRFLILCPNLIVRDRLEADFRQGKIFTDRGLIPSYAPFAADALALTTLGGASSASATDLFGANVVLSNIHQFYARSKTGQENLWALFGAQSTPFAIFNDEAHNSPAPEYYRTLADLREHEGHSFRLDTTATPDRADGRAPDSSMIYEYDIPAALNDGVIAKPVVYQPDIETVELTYTNVDTGEQRRVEEIDWDEVDKAGVSATQWVTDTKPMSQQISIALHRLREAKRNANGRYTPVLFVVAVCKADARKAQEMLTREFGQRTLLLRCSYVVATFGPEASGGRRREFGGSREYVVHLGGFELHVEGLAFQQQDRGVSACATTVLVGYPSGRSHGGTSRYDTRSDHRGCVPLLSSGRTVNQVCEAIRAGGLAPIVIPATSPERDRAQLLGYMRSGLAPVLAAETLSTREGHAVCAVGVKIGVEQYRRRQGPRRTASPCPKSGLDRNWSDFVSLSYNIGSAFSRPLPHCDN